MDSITPAPLLSARLDREQLSFKEFVQLLVSGKWLLLLTTLAFIGFAAVAAFVVAAKYEASILLLPIIESPSSGQLGSSSVSSGLSGLASLAGLSLGGNSKEAESVAVLESAALTERYVDANHLLPILFARDWDAARGSWRNGNPKDTPTLWKANRFFKSTVRSVSTDTKTGLITMTITWSDPHLAAKWANDLVKLANDYLRSEAIQQSDLNIAYLNEQASKTTLLPVKQAIYSLLQNEINKEMIARGSEEYAFKVLDPAESPERPAYPRKLLWIGLGGIIGLLVSIFAILLRAALQ